MRKEVSAMSTDEKLTQNIANKLSRRDFLKGLGALIASIGVAMVGNIETVEAGPACCPNPECSGCQHAGSNCPVGYTKISWTSCCLNYCKWTCNKCRRNSDGYICYCSHEDFVACPGGQCGNAPQQSSQPASLNG